MPIGSSVTFRILLDVVKHAIYIMDGSRQISRRIGRNCFRSRNRHPIATPQIGVSVEIPSGTQRLEAWIVHPEGVCFGSVLLCHGIGDRIPYWRRVQERLAKDGICSLVFHYSGYGRSGSSTTPANLANDLVAAYAWLLNQIPDVPGFVIGFSLGSGLAADTVGSLKPPPAGLILCEAFPTLRAAARRMGRALGFLAVLLPDIWHTRSQVARLRIPILIVHSTGDTLFPVSMAEEIFAASMQGGGDAELRVFEAYPHNAPYLWVPEDYWAAIVDFIGRSTKNIAIKRTMQ
jgi:fermentation-respiration switch protein FrsA (DUF1100 family)